MQNTMSNGKGFLLSTVISVYTGLLLPDPNKQANSNFIEVQKCLSFLVGEDLYTHACVRAKKEAAPYLAEWYPFLAELDTDLWLFDIKDMSNENYHENKVNALQKKHGTSVVLWQIPTDDHEEKDPAQELTDMGFEGKIITVDSIDNEDDISPYGTLPPKS